MGSGTRPEVATTGLSLTPNGHLVGFRFPGPFPGVILSQEYPLQEADLQVGRISIFIDGVMGAWNLV